MVVDAEEMEVDGREAEVEADAETEVQSNISQHLRAAYMLRVRNSLEAMMDRTKNTLSAIAVES